MSNDIIHVTKVMDIGKETMKILTEDIGIKKMLYFRTVEDLKDRLIMAGANVAEAQSISIFQHWYEEDYLQRDTKEPITLAFTEDAFIGHINELKSQQKTLQGTGTMATATTTATTTLSTSKGMTSGKPNLNEKNISEVGSSHISFFFCFRNMRYKFQKIRPRYSLTIF